MRPSHDETWMAVADQVAKRSDCSRRQVGAVIVDTRGRIVATGYNGPPAGFKRPKDSDCSQWCSRAQRGDKGPSYASCVSVHAEVNALLYTSRDAVEGGTLYVTSSCCWDCGKVVANSGIKRIVMILEERDAHRLPHETIQFIQDCGLEVEIIRK